MKHWSDINVTTNNNFSDLKKINKKKKNVKSTVLIRMKSLLSFKNNVII